jgi:hypothetical protein
MLVYIAPPLVVFILISLGDKWPPTFNRMDAVILKINEIINLKFVDNYTRIYSQLNNFEIATTKASEWQNLIEIVRHYIPLIYLIGLLEKFFKALFPSYLIPLAVGVWKARNRNNVFIILLTACYFLILYYYMFSKNSIRERYLLTPAFLLYPYIGVGLDRLCIYVKKSSRRRLFTILFVIFFALLPVYRSFRIIRNQETVLLVAGEWIATIPQFQTVKIITTDRRIPFYAGRGLDQTLYREPNYFAMEKLALQKNSDLLIIKTSKKSENSRPGLKKFMKVKEFAGTKDIVNIYCSPRLYRTVKGKT